MKKFAVGFLLLLMIPGLHAAEVQNLRCEYLLNPVGVEAASPRLSWTITSAIRGDLQRAFQVIVASSPEKLANDLGDLWDSGKTNSDQSAQVTYLGKPLQPGTKYHWKVRVWDIQQKSSDWSKPAFWSMGLPEMKDWQYARWIAYKDGDLWKKEWKQHKDSELKNLPPMKWPNTSWPWKTGKDRS